MPALDFTGGTVFRAGVNLGQVQRIIRAGADLWVRPSGDALDPATSDIMFVSNSLVSNRIEGNSYESGTFGPVYPWADDFRPEYAGGAGTANSPGYLFQPSTPLLGSDNNGSKTKNRWDQPDTFWSENCDPRRDLAGVAALVINQWNVTGTTRPYQWSNAAMDVQMREDVEYTLLFVAAAAAAGVSQIIIDGDPPQLLSTVDTADDSTWRAAINGAEQAHHYMRDRVREWLDANGHPGVAVRVIPYHRLAARLYDDALAAAIPDSITTHRALYAGWGEGGSTTHVYMRNRRGQLFENLLQSRVTFGRMPDTSGDYSARGVSSALMAYAVGIVEEIASTYAPAGLGGTDEGEVGVVPYDGETPAQIMPDATVHLIDFAAADLYSDRAGTTAAVDGGPVGRIIASGITFTAGSDGARPVLDGEMIHFTADPMPGTLPASITARYIAGIMPMIATTSDNITLKIGGLELNQRQDGDFIGIYSPGGNPLVSLSGWKDGRLVLAELISNGSQLEVRAVDMEAAAGAVRVRSMTDTENTYPTAGTAIQLSGDDWGNPNVSSPLLYLIASRQPNDAERAMLYEWMSARTGAVAW